MSRFESKLKDADVSRDAKNFSAKSLRPAANFPISLARDGTVISTFASACWDLSTYSDRPVRLWFGDYQLQANSVRIDKGNARTYRLATFQLLYGDRPPISATTVAAYHGALKSLFTFCTARGVQAEDLGKYPRVVKEFAKTVPGGIGRLLILVLRQLADNVDALGFCILDLDQIDDLERRIRKHVPSQYAYIPQRLYDYLITRTSEFIEDFLSHREGIEALFKYCLDAYISAYGSIDNFNSAVSRWRSNPSVGRRSPFGYMAKRQNSSYVSFAEAARMHGVDGVLCRWLVGEGGTLEAVDIGSFSRYLSGVTFVGQVQLATFTGMRVSETTILRSSCFEVDDDPMFGRAYLVRGQTTKTKRDENALWVTAKSSQRAVDAMSSVSRMRLSAGEHDSRTKVAKEDLSDPQLVLRAYEPWSSSKEAGASLDRLIIPWLGDWKQRLPTLLDREVLRITEDDFAQALRMTPSLDVEKFAVGKEWDFGFHQLRRTLVCNAASSDLVTMESLAAQLKHATVAQTWHYGNNYSSLKLNESVGRAYEDAIVDALMVRGPELTSKDFVSPLGKKGEERALELLERRELAELRKLAKKGAFSIRETALGVCLRGDPCPYGGWEHVAECISCTDAKLSRKKAGRVRDLKDRIEVEIRQCGERDAAKKSALEHQYKAAKKALELVYVE